MKHVIIATVLALSSMSAFAAGTAPQAKGKVVASATTSKVSKTEAKKECKAEGKKGKELKSCVKAKLEAVKS